jgi:hypothetical protein
MTPLVQLIAAVEAGLRPRFADLPTEARIQLTDTLVPKGRCFSEAERDLFAAHVLELDAESLEVVAEFNTLDHPHKAPIIPQQNGTVALPSNLLTWCGEGDGYHGLQELLWILPIVRNHPVQTPVNY